MDTENTRAFAAQIPGVNLQAGGVDYITKPFAPAEVLARVRLHLELRNLQRRLEVANREMEARVNERTREVREANHALGESERKFKDVFLGIQEGYVAIGRDGRVRLANPAAARLLGYPSHQDLLGVEVLDNLMLRRREALRLVVGDNGKGFPEGYDLGEHDSLGMRIVESLTRQVGDSLQLSSDAGPGSR